MSKNDSVISYITLGVNDLAKMQDFYTSLGFTLHAKSEAEDHPYTMYKLGVVILALYPKELFSKLVDYSINNSDKNAAMSVSLNVRNKDQVDSYISLAKEANAKIIREGFEPAWGGYCAYFKDLESNLWEIVWHERFTFESD